MNVEHSFTNTGESLFLQTGQKGVFTILTFTTYSHGEVLYLTDRDADVEELTEEEAESILIELVVNMLQIIFQ